VVGAGAVLLLLLLFWSCNPSSCLTAARAKEKVCSAPIEELVQADSCPRGRHKQAVSVQGVMLPRDHWRSTGSFAGDQR
jgi:hypothetical protein